MCPTDPDRHDDPTSIETDDSENGREVTSSALIEELVTANHILFDQGVVDAFGHISVRCSDRPDRFLLARNMAPGSVSAQDIIEFTLDSEPVDARGRRVYLERFIHGEIYRRRPEVMSVVHSHSHSIVPLSVVKGVKLRALFHVAGFIGQVLGHLELGFGIILEMTQKVKQQACTAQFCITIEAENQNLPFAHTSFIIQQPPRKSRPPNIGDTHFYAKFRL